MLVVTKIDVIVNSASGEGVVIEKIDDGKIRDIKKTALLFISFCLNFVCSHKNVKILKEVIK